MAQPYENILEDSEQRAFDMWRLADRFTLQDAAVIQHNQTTIVETIEKLQFALTQISLKEKLDARSR